MLSSSCLKCHTEYQEDKPVISAAISSALATSQYTSSRLISAVGVSRPGIGNERMCLERAVLGSGDLDFGPLVTYDLLGPSALMIV